LDYLARFYITSEEFTGTFLERRETSEEHVESALIARVRKRRRSRCDSHKRIGLFYDVGHKGRAGTFCRTVLTCGAGTKGTIVNTFKGAK